MLEIKSTGVYIDTFSFSPFTIVIPEGVKRIGVFGPNGSGKTTFFKILNGTYKSEVSFNNEKYRCEFLPQFFSVSNQFVRTYDFIQDVFEISQLEQREISYSEIQDLVEKKLSVLSGGEIKRLLFWIAEQKKSKIFLLDEVFANLDPKTEKYIEEKINLISDNEYLSACFISSHQKYLLERNCDWFIGLNQCEVVFNGSKEDFLNTKIFEELHEI